MSSVRRWSRALLNRRCDASRSSWRSSGWRDAGLPCSRSSSNTAAAYRRHRFIMASSLSPASSPSFSWVAWLTDRTTTDTNLQPHRLRHREHAYLLPVSAPWFALARAVQGASAGAIEVASMSAVAALFTETNEVAPYRASSPPSYSVSLSSDRRCRGVGEQPRLGLLCGRDDQFRRRVVAYRTNLGDRAFDPTPLPRLQWSPQLTGALVAASAGGLVIGVYEACWSLLMHAHHARHCRSD